MRRMAGRNGLHVSLLRRTIEMGLHGAKDRGDLAMEQSKLQGKDRAARMEDDIDRCDQERQVGCNSSAQAAFDAIAIVRLAKSLGNGEADARSGGIGPAIGRARGKKVSHLLGELLAAARVGMLIVGVLSQSGGRGHGWIYRRPYVIGERGAV